MEPLDSLNRWSDRIRDKALDVFFKVSGSAKLGVDWSFAKLGESPAANGGGHGTVWLEGMKDGTAIYGVRIGATTANVLKSSVDIAVKIAANKPAEKAEATATAGAESTEATSAATKIPGLEGEKAQSGYVIGLDIAKSLEPAKGEYDIDAMIKGLKAGETITSVNNQEVSSAADVQKVLDQAKKDGRTRALFQVESESGSRFVALPINQG